jgi:hypothetical protein
MKLGKKRWTIGLGSLAVVVAACVMVSRGVSQEKADPGPQDEAAAETMAKWLEYNSLGPEHESMKNMLGEWDLRMKMWMMPGAPPTESGGKAVFEPVFGGRFVRQTFTCAMMGMPYEGMGFTGYDRFKGKYVSLWLDNMSNSVYMALGSKNASDDTYTYYGTIDDPTTGEQDILTRSVMREVSPDEAVMEMYEKRSGQDEMMTMEIRYTRRK